MHEHILTEIAQSLGELKGDIRSLLGTATNQNARIEKLEAKVEAQELAQARQSGVIWAVGIIASGLATAGTLVVSWLSGK